MSFSPSDRDAFLGQAMPPLLGNALCLDLVNTLNPRTGRPVDFLRCYTDLLVWAYKEKLISKSHAAALLEHAQAHPSEAETVFLKAIEFREAIYQIFFALARGQEPTKRALGLLRNLYAEAVIHSTLQLGGFRWVEQPNELSQILWPVAESAITLLRHGECARLKECANHATCGWLFYDTTKNNGRRWCSMQDCGNQEKVRLQRKRRQKRAIP
jgi:predicted RNA-binding Zn ribbon-like protein